MQLVGWVERSETQLFTAQCRVSLSFYPTYEVLTLLVRSRAIHAPLFFQYKRRNELRDYKRVLFLN